MIVIDASVMIAFLNPADAHSSAARALFETTSRVRLVAHRLTIAETLVGAARADVTRAVLRALDSVGVGRLDEPDDPADLAELRARTGLKMPDACVLLAARRDGAHLATFDSRMARAARDEGIPVVAISG